MASAAEPTGYRELVDEGLREFDAQNFEEARSLFLRAHALAPSARTHRALGLVEFELRSYLDCIAHLEQALGSDVKPLTAEQHAEAQQILDRALGFVGRLHVDLRPASAELWADGVRVSKADYAPLLLAIGHHALEVRAASFESETREVTIKGGETATLSIVLAPARSPAKSERGPTSTRKPWYKSAWLWAGLGVVVAGAAGAASYVVLREDSSPEPSGGTSNTVLPGP